MVGGESRKSRAPFAATKFKPLSNSPLYESGTSSKNTNLKGLTSFIVRNVLNSVASQCGQGTSSARTMTSSENTGDVMVEKTPATIP